MSNDNSTKPTVPEVDAIDPTVALDIDTARAILVTEEPYFAVLLQSCNFRWDARVKTAGVRVTSKAEVELCVSPLFWQKMVGYYGLGLLKHEMLHLVLEHLSRGKELVHKISNLAMDISLNQYIKRHWLPEGGFLHTGPHLPNGPKNPEEAQAIELFKKMNLKPEENFEYYYLELMKNKEDVQNMFPMDNHSWQLESGETPGDGKEGDGEGKGTPTDAGVSDELRRIAIDNILQKALEETRDRFPGRVPFHVEQAMAERFKPAKINWKRELRSYIGRYISSQLEGTRCRLNRRLGLAAPGFRKTFAPKIMIGIDSSGSVPDSMYASFMSEIRELLKDYDEKVELFFYDYAVCEKKLKLDKMHKMPRRPACGGTSFQAAIDYATTQKPDLLLMLTDGGDSPPKKTPYPVMWAIFGGYKNDGLIGKIINVEEDEKKAK